MHKTRKDKERELQLKREIKKRSLERSLAAFSKEAWPLLEPGRPYKHNWHIDAICDHLEAVADRQIRNLIINVPPRSMKSLLVCVFFPVWRWIHHPGENFMFASYSPKLASRDAVKARKILESEWFLSRWAKKFIVDDESKQKFKKFGGILSSEQNEKMRYENIASGIRISTSLGGTGTGDGGDILVGDDLSKASTIGSETMREAAINWYDNEFSNRGNDPKTVCKVVIMQRLHHGDVSGHLLEKGGYDHLCLPFEFEKKFFDLKPKTSLGFQDPRTEENEVLWKNRYDEKAVKDLKESFQNVYQRTGQLQQRPTPSEGTIFKREWFKKRWSSLPSKFDYMLTTWDLTFGDTGNAYNVGYAIGKKGPDFYVVDEVRAKMDITRQLRMLPLLNDRNPQSREILIEDAANGKAAAALLSEKIPGVILVRPTGSKEDRANSVTYLFEANNIVFPDDRVTTWAEDAVEEFISFGSRAIYKDRVDALVHGIERMRTHSMNIAVAPVSLEKVSAWNI